MSIQAISHPIKYIHNIMADANNLINNPKNIQEQKIYELTNRCLSGLNAIGMASFAMASLSFISLCSTSSFAFKGLSIITYVASCVIFHDTQKTQQAFLNLQKKCIDFHQENFMNTIPLKLLWNHFVIDFKANWILDKPLKVQTFITMLTDQINCVQPMLRKISHTQSMDNINRNFHYESQGNRRNINFDQQRNSHQDNFKTNLNNNNPKTSLLNMNMNNDDMQLSDDESNVNENNHDDEFDNLNDINEKI